ncbi:hypothetical protein DBV15_05735 [Temnothorax longispinosus]|uniref:Uncharacterized protein n=1 Tax=Temnothorax longispinosus TaxID=300112 RepID=A0A4S2KF25_9HYME|nr:hypothetical protein DBV15_05735 [Temnothorax longispinosus]
MQNGAERVGGRPHFSPYPSSRITRRPAYRAANLGIASGPRGRKTTRRDVRVYRPYASLLPRLIERRNGRACHANYEKHR